MESLIVRLGLPNPDAHVSSMTREIHAHGFTSSQPDWMNDPVQLIQQASTTGRRERSAIEGAIIAGSGQGVDMNKLWINVGTLENPDPVQGALPDLFQDLPQIADKDQRLRSLYKRLNNVMDTTYSMELLEQMDAAHDDVRLSALQRADRLQNFQPETPAATGEKLEGFMLENLREASMFQTALIRMIPVMAESMVNGWSEVDRIAFYQEIARNSERFIREMSYIPSILSTYIGEDLYKEPGEEATAGLWDSIVLAGDTKLAESSLLSSDPEIIDTNIRDRFALVVSPEGKVSVYFSEEFLKHLKEKVDYFKTTINPATGKPMLTDVYGCPGIRTINGHKVNIEMWRDFVEIAPTIWKIQAA